MYLDLHIIRLLCGVQYQCQDPVSCERGLVKRKVPLTSMLKPTLPLDEWRLQGQFQVYMFSDNIKSGTSESISMYVSIM